jgi:hypothetical protein
MFPSPHYNPDWFEHYWLTPRPPRRRRRAGALRRLALALTQPLVEPHSRADARGPACQPSVLRLPPI